MGNISYTIQQFEILKESLMLAYGDDREKDEDFILDLIDQDIKILNQVLKKSQSPVKWKQIIRYRDYDIVKTGVRSGRAYRFMIGGQEFDRLYSAKRYIDNQYYGTIEQGVE